jgi:hypothetical protein
MERPKLKLRVTSIYGWGWFEGDEPTAFEVPPEFDLTVEILMPSDKHLFALALGQVFAEGHSLNGFWVSLSPRHVVVDGMCNLSVFKVKPSYPEDGLVTKDWKPPPSEISGFASIALKRE